MKKTKGILKWIPKTIDQKRNSLGIHLIAEFWYGKNIEDEKKLRNLLLSAAKKAKSRPLEIIVHQFKPQGISGVILLAESHIALHFWPEYHYCGIDIFTCGKESNPQKALYFLKEVLKPKKVVVKKIERGLLDEEFS